MTKSGVIWSIGVFVVSVATLALGACSSSAPSANGGNNGGATCPQDNPECKDIADVPDGELAVQRRRCNTCHDSPAGKMAGSTTPLANQDPGVQLYPPNLTNDKDTGIGNWTDDQLANAMRTGLDEQGLQLCPQMKHFADMTDFEAYSIVKYLRSLPAVANKVPRSICPPLKTADEQNQ